MSEETARRLRWLARRDAQAALDDQLAGDPVALAALKVRYEPIDQFRKEGPDVGEPEEAESEAGRVN